MKGLQVIHIKNKVVCFFVSISHNDMNDVYSTLLSFIYNSLLYWELLIFNLYHKIKHTDLTSGMTGDLN